MALPHCGRSLPTHSVRPCTSRSRTKPPLVAMLYSLWKLSRFCLLSRTFLLISLHPFCPTCTPRPLFAGGAAPDQTLPCASRQYVTGSEGDLRRGAAWGLVGEPLLMGNGGLAPGSAPTDKNEGLSQLVPATRVTLRMIFQGIIIKKGGAVYADKRRKHKTPCWLHRPWPYGEPYGNPPARRGLCFDRV